jgi:hypothetical protein
MNCAAARTNDAAVLLGTSADREIQRTLMEVRPTSPRRAAAPRDCR